MRAQPRAILEHRFRAWSSGRTRSILMAASFLGLVLTAESAAAQCYGGSVRISSGNNQIGAPNTPLAAPLVVEAAIGPAGDSSPCALESLTWTVNKGSATLGATTTQTLANGLSTNTLTIGNTPGIIDVSVTGATAAGTVHFTVTAVAGTQATQASAAASQAVTLGSLGVLTSTVQTNNIGLRLQALRQGARGASLSGLPLKLAALSESGDAIDGPSALAKAVAAGLPRQLGVFVNALGSFGNQDATARDPGFDFHTIGATVGADYRFTDRFILGLAGSYLRTKLDLDASAGDTRANGYSLSAYTNYYILEKLYVDGIATFGWNFYDTERHDTAGNGTAKANTDGPQVSVSVGSGYDFNVRPLKLTPTVRANYIHVHIDGYHETGAGSSNARISSQTVESFTTNVGGQAIYAIGLSWGVLSPFVRAEWVHEFMGDSRTVTASVGSAVVPVQTDSPDRDYLNLGVGASAAFKGGVSAFLDYDVVLGRTNFTNHSFTGGVRIEF